MDCTEAAKLLRACAAGRREYAASIPADVAKPSLAESRRDLLAEATTLDTAARIVEGDTGPLYDLLPSWRWTPEMHAALDRR
jgi:hypothetical protein